ncbi:hypothetical protein CSIM01_13866 [Colletotrichum simmondsii]|uniref:Uncharacterized protein n=1 Tax=Colletotrichum simmondsii TaxID=703756 RepID=A0A135RXZ0_9PEZI|nr:hypothetical protein CSIM01_13866 [Colletotrichum simmondsii]
MSTAKSCSPDPKRGFEWQLELIMTNMAASEVISGKEAAEMATDCTIKSSSCPH